MGTKWTKMSVKENVKELIMVDCKTQFLKNHPEMKGMKITESFMLNQIALDYIEEEYEHY